MVFMPTVQKKAIEISGELKGAGYGFDPAMLIAIITAVVQLFQGCQLTPQQAERSAANPRLLDRLVLRRLIRQHSNGQDEDALHAALLDAGNALTAADLTALYSEIVP